MSTFSERLQNNATVATQGSSTPQFQGQQIGFNGQTGKLSLFEVGHFNELQEIKSLTFVTDFIMRRLKFTDGTGKDAETTTSNYVIGDDTTPYEMSFNGSLVSGKTKKEFLKNFGKLKPAQRLSQENIYIGYLVSVDGQAQETATPVWYVSRGTQMYNLNVALDKNGGLTAQTLISLGANGKSVQNKQGGFTQMLDFEVSQLDPERLPKFIEWLDNSEAPQKVQEYREQIESLSQQVENHNDYITETDISDDDLPF